ncbi:Na(+)-translocating NADH-quinone reductase subunit C [Botrimarina hoheduenensis]|uniref:Na(+)-translocating NADH-quinone reductase subunit C n=1 Tax=Botrimarina hoheduenensis TaxID=2528000 RepID=A0A5C5VQT2_9BACT|nr:Na(+)-translocating NADH-quinone reductase subunit C [Botrimarina hoheduenensis]TWT40161.1 Na(+)-translocating NADH-quinone reductase subunit C [Botrimarina hoheduenensis]
MPPRNSWLYTVIVALVLCLVCSALVSIAAVSLNGIQQKNKELDKRKNILLAAGLCEPGTSASEVAATYEKTIVEMLVDLDTGQIVDVAKPGEKKSAGEANKTAAPASEGDQKATEEPAAVTLASYDPRKAAKNPKTRDPVEPAGALPGIAYREPYASIYEIREDGKTTGYILPIYGKGLWSTLYGFLALEADKETVRGITYYSHAETPGLGGEVDNAGWKALWPGKKVYEDSGEVGLSVIKGKASEDDSYAIDGLSGATITSNGVDDMIKYWLGPTAFGKYLAAK